MDSQDLRPQLRRLHDQVSELRSELEAKLTGLTEEQLSWTPSPDRWSIAQVLDHIDRSNSSVIPRFDHALDKAGPAGAEQQGEVRYTAIEKTCIDAISPGTSRMLPVPSVYRPRIEPNQGRQAVNRVLEQQGELLGIIERADEFRLHPLRITSPVTSLIRMRFLPYLDGIVQHERYHWLQAESLLGEAGFPAA